MTKVTFYGHFSGWSSYPSVCKAMARWLWTHGVDLELCDLRQQGAYEGVEDIPQVTEWVRRVVIGGMGPGEKAGVSLLFGFPSWAQSIPRHDKAVGFHVGDVDRVPKEWVTAMNQEDLVLTPSAWCKSAFERSGVTVPVQVVNHGVHPRPIRKEPHEVQRLRMLHCCSAVDPLRKGTRELASALQLLAVKKQTLHDVPIDFRLNPGTSRYGLQSSQNINLLHDQPGPPEMVEQLLSQTGLLVAPSRAEGFGLLPLEALAQGIPVVATECTGHAEYLPADGAKLVRTGTLAPCGGAQAPSLDITDIVSALVRMGAEYHLYSAEAIENAPKVQAQWSWDAVLTRGGLLDALRID